MTNSDLEEAGRKALHLACDLDPSLHAHVDPVAIEQEARLLGAEPITCLEDVLDRQQDILERIYCPPTKGKLSHWDSALASPTTKYDAPAALQFLIRLAWGVTGQTVEVKTVKKKNFQGQRLVYPSMWPGLSNQAKIDHLRKVLPTQKTPFSATGRLGLAREVSLVLLPILAQTFELPPKFPVHFSGNPKARANKAAFDLLVKEAMKEYAALLLEFQCCSRANVPLFMPPVDTIRNYLQKRRPVVENPNQES